MLPDFAGLDVWAVLTATIAAVVLGALWYGPWFGRGFPAQRAPQPGLTAHAVNGLAAAVVATTLGALVATLGIGTVVDGGVFGALIGLGVVAISMAADAAFGLMGLRPFAVQAGYRVAAATLTGAILGGWP
jgi:hypothetical protein